MQFHLQLYCPIFFSIKTLQYSLFLSFFDDLHLGPARRFCCIPSQSEVGGGFLKASLADEKGTFPHYMLKEIFSEKSKAYVTPYCRGCCSKKLAVKLEDIHIPADDLRALRRINIVASGTSRHAGMAGST